MVWKTGLLSQFRASDLENVGGEEDEGEDEGDAEEDVERNEQGSAEALDRIRLE